MTIFEGEMDRVLTLLRQKIRERGYTQLEVQRELSWGRSYISQLLTKQKALRVEQVLLILGVIGVDPGVFFSELYPVAGSSAASAIPEGGSAAVSDRRSNLPGSRAETPDLRHSAWSTGDRRSLHELRYLVRGLVGLLADKELIDLDDLTCAVRDSRGHRVSPELDGGQGITSEMSSH